MVNNSEMAETGPVRGPWTCVHSRVQIDRNGTLTRQEQEVSGVHVDVHE